MKDGGILSQGIPKQVITEDMLRLTYDVEAKIADVHDRKICILG